MDAAEHHHLRLLAAGALDEPGAQAGGAKRRKRQTGPPLANLLRQFAHLRMDEEARITAGEGVDHFRLLFLISDHVPPARQRHRDSVRRSRNRLAKLLALPDRVLM